MVSMTTVRRGLSEKSNVKIENPTPSVELLLFYFFKQGTVVGFVIKLFYAY